MTFTPLNLTQFLTDYFIANHCKVVSNNNGLLSVKLSEEIDKEIMNRPFYWQYVKATGQKGEPMTLFLQTNIAEPVEDKKAEPIHFGSPRLHTIFNQLRQSGRFVRLFEVVNTHTNTMLYPWLVINMLISYQGKQKRDKLFSIGLQLINGTMVFNMMEQLEKVPLNRSISNYCYTISPLIKPYSGFQRINDRVTELIHNEPHEWAEESLRALDEELQLINFFYQENEDEEEKIAEIKQATDRYHPKIVFNAFSGGLFYLSDSFMNHN